MKAYLMYPERDFDLGATLPPNASLLTQDLELATLWDAMADGDAFLREVARHAVLDGVSDLDTIRYRQHILADCLNNPSVVRELYALATAAIDGEKRNYWGLFSHYPSTILHRSIAVLKMFADMLTQLTQIAEHHAQQFESEGFTRFFAMVARELGTEYLARIHHHLRDLQFRDGLWMSASLGKGNKGTHYILHRPPTAKQPRWIKRLAAQHPPVYSYVVADRDETGAKALSELRDRGINRVANALAQSTDHILSFFTLLRTELAFYVGCLNLHETLGKKGEPLAFPHPAASEQRRLDFRGLYDVCLALRLDHRVVGNTVAADGKDLIFVTGANQGGKSTFLRSIGLAQLMMQCGMFVAAEAFSANVSEHLFTHYKREEDRAMNSGKLDEEVGRMSDIADQVTAHSLVLFNESFAATNEREGSEIARQIVSALLEKHIKVVFVTHLYELARGFHDKHLANALFLRAQRQADGGRTFTLHEGKPLNTSHGDDLYRQIFKTV
ncbi:MAG: DNA mismatch repair protein MutS [Thermaerobacter sp.]|nr:DNA mismatch repair protein MutS [Thermaerobacter sp.]